ncbi:pseudaminic acid cytidylyltransferase [Shewanella sairae]|uniref:Pseudaminic acid cytidylyltransferase n=1 Tax=Shewanella sairae TaxID=190310 RepID=A0ABQ4PQB1_9GAMM|nr:pseudaminic acid cytidylyltransferase [Shewanella sairae]MCL1129278.1 pseudaminic acid cytidylyltransferase [Shewanella sairae]GIU51250.1 pseudaminic acid cytidylyltransferase [Shewanella sairae]
MKIAVIPARGGSKRIPHKNIKDFCGKPMIAHAIETAIATGCFDKVLVSTDCSNIASVAEAYGAWVPFIRPNELADDYTGTTPVIRHSLNWLKDHGYQVTHCCCLYATSPLLTSDTLVKGLKQLEANTEFDYVFSACRFSFPIQRALVETANGGTRAFDQESIGMRSQDLVATYHDAGQFYWGKVEAFLDPERPVFGERGSMLVLPANRVQDIDTEEDWLRAELMYQLLNRA